MTQETKAKDCCHGTKPLSDCQCEKDRLAALAAEPSSLEYQSEIDKDLVRTYYGDLVAFYRVRAALATAPTDALAHSEANCRGLRQRAEAAETKLAALAATPAVGGEARKWIIDLIHNEYDPKPSNYRIGDNWNDGAEEIADQILERLRNV